MLLIFSYQLGTEASALLTTLIVFVCSSAFAETRDEGAPLSQEPARSRCRVSAVLSLFFITVANQWPKQSKDFLSLIITVFFSPLCVLEWRNIEYFALIWARETVNDTNLSPVVIWPLPTLDQNLTETPVHGLYKETFSTLFQIKIK